MTDSSPSQRPTAAEVYEAFLARRAAGQAEDFEELCRAYPELADELRDRYARGAGTAATISEVREVEPPPGRWSGTTGSSGPPGGPQLPGTSDPSSDLPTGSTRYRLGEEIGRGGMGRILDVWDRYLDRHLAMKIENTDARQADARRRSIRLRRFVDEARITGQLDHPGVVPVHELGKDEEGRLFFTMRRVRGHDLKTVFQMASHERDGWTPPRVLEVFVKICDTLAYAHANGIVHRDLKPENVMVGIYGEVYVMDWGLAKLRGVAEVREDEDPLKTSEPADELRTRAGTVLGTLAYMPPEQALGEIDAVDERSDVYAVGAMLYEFLAGRRPRDASSMSGALEEALVEIRDSQPLPLDALHVGVPEELSAICEKAMRAVPDERYADAAEMGADIRAYLENRVVRAHRTGPWIELKKWLRRNRAVAAGWLAFLSAVGLGLIGVILVQWSLNAVIERQGYVSRVNAASWLLERGDVLQAGDFLDDCQEELRGWEWKHLNLKRDGSLRVLEGHRGGVFAIAVTPDGRAVASASEDRTVRIWDLESGTGASRVLRGVPSRLLCVAFSADGARVAAGGEQGEVVVWSIASERVLGLHASPGDRVLAVGFDPDSGEILAVDRRGHLARWRVGAEGLEALGRSELFAASVNLTAAAFDIERRRLACALRVADKGQVHTALRLVNLRDLAAIEELPGHDELCFSLDFGAGGTRLASAAGDDSIRIWDLTSPRSEPVALRGHGNRVLAVAFSGDGERLASGGGDNTVRTWSVATGRELAVYHGHTEEVFAVRWRNGGGLLSGGRDGALREWPPDGPLEMRVHAVEGAAIADAAFSPRGQRIAVALREQTTTDKGEAPETAETVVAQIRDAHSGRTLENLTGGAADATSLDWSPDGRRLLVGKADGSLELFTASTIVDPGVSERLSGHSQEVLDVAFHPGGEIFASSSIDRTVRIWDPSSGRLSRRLDQRDAAANAVAWGPDGQVLAIGGRDGVIRIVSSQDGSLLHTFEGHESGVSSLTFEPGERWLISASRDKTLRLWDLREGTLERVLRGHQEGVLAVTVHPDGHRIASAGWDRTVRIWALPDGDLLTILRGHEGRVHCVDFEARGARLLSASWDRTVRIWETQRPAGLEAAE